jgi:hypothetical protein
VRELADEKKGGIAAARCEMWVILWSLLKLKGETT